MGSRCEVCGLRGRAESKPNALISRLWSWHTTWRPSRKAYQNDGPRPDPNRQQPHRQR
jgi:hypothetical protein